MIKIWRHAGLQKFYETGNTTHINSSHQKKLHRILQLLDHIRSPEQLHFPGLKLLKLAGGLKGFYAIKITGHWRIIFRFEGPDIILVDYLDMTRQIA